MTEGCDARLIQFDTVNTDFTCHAWWSDGDSSATVHIHRDATPPTVTVTPDRAPDANGWYNHAVAFAYTGADPTSGVAACSRVAYAGPDNQNASVTGTCSDNAGNVTSVTTPLKYDATPPKIKKFELKARKGGARLHWHGLGGREVRRAPARARPEGCRAERRLPRRRPRRTATSIAACGPAASIATN